LILLFPESPRWLIDHGHVERGLETLAKLHANGDTNDAWVRAEFEQIQESITIEHEHAAKSYVELFRDKSCSRRLFLACSIQASIQMTGVRYVSPPTIQLSKYVFLIRDAALSSTTLSKSTKKSALKATKPYATKRYLL
jgi:hypothetical protein